VALCVANPVPPMRTPEFLAGNISKVI